MVRNEETCNSALWHVSNQGFQQAKLPLAGEKADEKRPTTTMKTFQALSLMPQAPKKKKEKEESVSSNAFQKPYHGLNHLSQKF